MHRCGATSPAGDAAAVAGRDSRHGPELPLASVATAVLEGGAGPSVVLLHSSGEFATLWRRVIPHLATTHHVVAPDLPGTAPRASPTARSTPAGCSPGWAS